MSLPFTLVCLMSSSLVELMVGASSNAFWCLKNGQVVNK